LVTYPAPAPQPEAMHVRKVVGLPWWTGCSDGMLVLSVAAKLLKVSNA